jgi:hypothetical protein
MSSLSYNEEYLRLLCRYETILDHTSEACDICSRIIYGSPLLSIICYLYYG